ncbi:MAG: uroporphyrinogen-III C-methyltransferase [Gammaproteobacteria bacterium]|nr:uroporphyrinogen-III C-methyltransferase [Gammaproteobacteria bacterium]
MTDNNEPTPDSGAEETSAGGDRQNSRDRGWRGLDAVIIALLLVALGLGGTSLYLARQLLEQQQDAMERHDEHAGTLTELVANQEELQAVVRRVDEAQQATSAALERFAERERMDNLDWAMAEVEYLTIIAMQRLNLGSDADTAQAALEAAARRLKDIDNPSPDPGARAADEVTSMPCARYRKRTCAGLALYLGDLITRAEQLPLASDSATRSRAGRRARHAERGTRRGLARHVAGHVG